MRIRVFVLMTAISMMLLFACGCGPGSTSGNNNGTPSAGAADNAGQDVTEKDPAAGREKKEDQTAAADGSANTNSETADASTKAEAETADGSTKAESETADASTKTGSETAGGSTKAESETADESTKVESEADDASKKTESEKTEKPETILAVSEIGNFSFSCGGEYIAEELENGQIDVYLNPDKHTYPVVSVRRVLSSKSAKELLSKDADEIRADSGIEELIQNPGDPELIEFDERDFYEITSEYTKNGKHLYYDEYAEEYEDGTTMIYSALYPKKQKDASKKQLEQAMKTIWVGEAGESMLTPEATPEPAETRRVVSGRWTVESRKLENGDTEYVLNDTFVLTTPPSWDDTSFWIANGEFLTFYHKASYDAWIKKGKPGGAMFSVTHYMDDSYEYLPSYTYIGPAEDGGYYVLAYPTDVQGYPDDQRIWDEWTQMFHDVDKIRDTAYSMIFK